ncbi:hypothetical protein ACO0QE_002833 [Hanseniaspora vineae]
MSLFKVDGWDLKTSKVAADRIDKKNKKSKDSKKLKNSNKDNTKPHSRSERSHEKDDASIEKSHLKTQLPKTEKKVSKNITKKSDKKAPVKLVQNDAAKTSNIPSSFTPNSNKKLTPLQQKMMAKLSGSRFRWINEQLYTTTSEKALDMITKQPELFSEYHQGFRSQVESWPENPVDVFVSSIIKRGAGRPINAPGGLPGVVNPETNQKKVVIADMGCGEAQLSLDVANYFNKYNKKNKQKKLVEVHSFDLTKYNDRITVADIKHVPMEDESCSIVVFCLALMGTNFLDFIKEAYRIMAPRGELWIAEIKSRFGDGKGDEFVEALKLQGFFHKSTDNENKMFTKFEFHKPSEDILKERIAKLERTSKFVEVESKKEELDSKREKQAEGKWLLKPCIYKRR